MIFAFLLLFPLAVAASLLLVKNDMIRNLITYIGAVIVAALSVAAVVCFFGQGVKISVPGVKIIKDVLIFFEAFICIYVIYIGIRHKKYLAPVLAFLQTSALIIFELTSGKGLEAVNDIVFDKLTAIMVLIIGVVGGLICIYAVGYMKWYHVHHGDYKERKGFFFAVLFLFLSAMFGLVLFNEITMMYFCWELTTLCSFLLIGYTKTKEATNNAFRAITLNLLGGAGFAAGIILMGLNFKTLELSVLLTRQPELILLTILVLFSFAALTKSAQFPFSSWLLGAMVAPTPTSALLHSATMVKAGVYFIIRLAPLLGITFVGKTVTIVGGITFLIASFIAITQSDAKKILAYSTIANLGLIIACAGVGTPESLWAAILLIIFHAVAKSLLFLSVGSVEHQIGSRNVEDMEDLVGASRWLSMFMLIGMAGMFLAPFGMLISKWAAMKAFIDSNNIYIIILLLFGSSATLFYWTKWMGKIIGSVNKHHTEKHSFHKEEKIPLFVLSVFTIAACFLFPLISQYALIPYLKGVYQINTLVPISSSDIWIMIVMLLMLIILPISFMPIYKNDKRRIVPIYMAGENSKDDKFFYGGMGKKVKLQMRNWYMQSFFDEKDLTETGNMVAIVAIVANVILLIWGVIS